MPADPGIDPGVSGNRTHGQRTDKVYRGIPFHVVRELDVGSQLSLPFGRRGGSERYNLAVTGAGVQRKIRLKKAEPGTDSPPFRHVPVRGLLNSVCCAAGEIFEDIRKNEMRRGRARGEKGCPRLQRLEAVVVA